MSSSLLLPIYIFNRLTAYHYQPLHSSSPLRKYWFGKRFISHLKQSTFGFNEQQRQVSLHMDEIHLKSVYSYKGGKIIGSSNSSNKFAKTILGIMVSSLFTKWSTIVRLLPCSETSASEIFPITKKVIGDIESCNLLSLLS